MRIAVGSNELLHNEDRSRRSEAMTIKCQSSVCHDDISIYCTKLYETFISEYSVFMTATDRL
jgi:hypothetical protein